MRIDVEEMAPSEAGLVVDYFHDSSPEHLEMMGVDPTRLPHRDAWRERFAAEAALPRAARPRLVVIWRLHGEPVGFSSCDRITFGERANMHLHVLEEARRRQGIGTECVRRSAALYFRWLELQRLYCEPNAFNVGPNRTLQRAGFRYVKTYRTVPGPLNFHQPVTQWILEGRPSAARP
jgi:RimJ/RimL family protein N-acetyltransferase